MPVYGMKDASNLILLDKATGLPALYINYANATTAEFSADSVYATAKGANAIRWDQARNGTLTIDTELFDLGLLAMTMGSDIEEGSAEVFQRRDAVLDSSFAVSIGSGLGVVPESLSVVKLNSIQDTEHSGEPLFNQSASEANLPGQVKSLSVSANDVSASVSFNRVNNSSGYKILRDGIEVASTKQNTYTDSGLTPGTKYKYTVVAYNDFGDSPASAAVEATTADKGVKETTTYTATQEAIAQSAANKGAVVTPDASATTYSYSAGTLTFNNANVGDAYAIYYMEEVQGARTLTISADKFSGAYEIYADARIRPRDGGADELVYIHYFNARPQSDFTLTQSATDPTSLSIVFDLFPEQTRDANGEAVETLAEIQFID
mgnify:CR=1 FL=1